MPKYLDLKEIITKNWKNPSRDGIKTTKLQFYFGYFKEM
jgi:hypothetical protein